MPRLAQPADVPDVVRLINAAYRVEAFFVDGDRTTIADIRTHLETPGAAFLVIDDAARRCLAGAVHVSVSGTRGHFGLLSVDPERQGTGLGRTLVEAAERYCRDAGCSTVDLDYVNVREELPAFYRRLGYRETGVTAPLPPTEKLKHPAHLVEMRKSL